jgi:hypothetical protein
MAHSKIVFDHLAKSAGTSGRRFFADSVGHDRVSRPLGGYVINHIHLFERFDVLQGHFYGRVLYKIHPDVKYVTILRHPIERFLSYYYYVRSCPAEHPHKELAKQLTIDDFINHKSHSVLFILSNNATTHFASAMGDMRLPVKRLLSEAKKNLAKYDVVGITENLPAFFEDCCRAFRWPKPRQNYTENVTQNRTPSKEINSETIDIIASYNRLDLELYAFVRNLIDHRRVGVNVSLPVNQRSNHDDYVTIDQPGIKVNLLEVNGQPKGKVTICSGQKLSLRLSLQSDSISDDAITVAFCLSNGGPVELFQSSSQLLGHDIKLRPGDRMIIKLECLMPLDVGEYFLELCVMHAPSSAVGILIYFRNKEFISITVDRPANYCFLGAVNLCPKLVLEDL